MSLLSRIIHAILPELPPQPESMREAVGQMIDPDDEQWRPLSGDAQRDLNPMTQRRMQDLGVYLWESNLLANRLIELPIAYILAEGVKLKAEDENVQALIEQFWQHPVNNMDIKLIKKVRELALYGEQCWPTFVNEFSGDVRLGYLDPCLIATVVVDPDNGEQPIGIVTVKNKKGEAKRYRVIVNGPEAELFTQRTIDIRQTFTDGDCFYFCINDLSNGRRGRSDLLPQVDWLDGYDQFLFGESDRVQFLRAFMWDVTLAGATETDVKQKAKQIAPPKPGSVRVHNDAEIWKAESPNINAADTDTSAKLFRNHILGGATIPEHWFGGAGDVNRATGEDMSGPTFKVMSMRQAFIGYMLIEIGKYVIRQYELAHTHKEPDLHEPIYALEVQWPEMIPKDTTRYAAALQQVVAACAQALTANLVSQKTAVELIESIAGRLGVDIDAEAELEAIKQNPGIATDTNGTQGSSLDAAQQNPGNTNVTEAVSRAAAKRNDPPAELADQLAKRAQPKIDAMVQTVADLLETVDTLREAQTKLDQLFPDLHSDDLAELLAQGIIAANLVGRADVERGA